MAFVLEWRKEPSSQHTGSTELRGLNKKSAPMIYAHPEDNSGVNRASSSVRWTYTPGDGATDSFSSQGLTLCMSGSVSYSRYQTDRARFNKLAWYKTLFGSSKFGQDNAGFIFKALGLATGLQSSGSLAYKAYVRIDPPDTKPVKVSLTADMSVHATANATQNVKAGMAGSVDATAEIRDDEGKYIRLREMAKIVFPVRLEADAHTETYTVTIDPGEEVHIGTIVIGLAHEIRAGATGFVAIARIDYTVNPAGTPDAGLGLTPPDDSGMGPEHD